MRAKSISVVVTLLLSSVLMAAQTDSKAEVFGGYSYLRVNPSGGGFNTKGWEAALTGNINQTLGITADFDGHYGSPFGADGKIYNFLFGPKRKANGGKAAFVGNGLGGASHASANGFSDTAGAWDLGGGVDLNAGSGLGFRVAQLDYLGTHFSGETQHNLRLSTGLVFRF